MSQADSLSPSVPLTPEAVPGVALPPRRVLITRVLAVVAIAGLLFFIAAQGRSLYQEWNELRGQQDRIRASNVIGYPGVQPMLSYAQPPSPWYQNEGKTTRLWGGWQDGTGHHWFLTETGDVSLERISHPIGRDFFRAIDHPIVEFEGGEIWARIPEDAPVAGDSLGGVETVYPILVLQKVWIVNDQIRETPFLILFNPYAAVSEKRVSVYESKLDGQRLTMGHTGYVHIQGPMLYDRGTTSLWIPDDDSLHAVSGAHKGQRLKRVSHASVVDWSRWSREHPRSRLVIGADRTRDVPDL